MRPDVLATYTWTNNNCESYNHKLKQLVHWKSQKLVDLIKELEKEVHNQFSEARKAMFDSGSYKLVEHFSKLTVSKDQWFALCHRKRQKKMNKFYNMAFQ